MLSTCREASEGLAEAQGLMSVAEHNAQPTAILAAAQEQVLQMQEHAKILDQKPPRHSIRGSMST